MQTLENGDKFVFLGFDGLKKELESLDGREESVILHVDGVQPFNNSDYSYWAVLTKVRSTNIRIYTAWLKKTNVSESKRWKGAFGIIFLSESTL